MEFRRWVAGAAVLLSAGMLANCGQIFGSGVGGQGAGATAAMPGDSAGHSARRADKDRAMETGKPIAPQ